MPFRILIKKAPESALVIVLVVLRRIHSRLTCVPTRDTQGHQPASSLRLMNKKQCSCSHDCLTSNFLVFLRQLSEIRHCIIFVFIRTSRSDLGGWFNLHRSRFLSFCEIRIIRSNRLTEYYMQSCF